MARFKADPSELGSAGRRVQDQVLRLAAVRHGLHQVAGAAQAAGGGPAGAGFEQLRVALDAAARQLQELLELFGDRLTGAGEAYVLTDESFGLPGRDGGQR
jgi:uncharacterized protein YukE